MLSSKNSLLPSLPSFWKLGLLRFLLLVIRIILLLLLYFFTSIFQLPLLQRVKNESQSESFPQHHQHSQSHFGTSPKNVKTQDSLTQAPYIIHHSSGMCCLQHLTAPPQCCDFQGDRELLSPLLQEPGNPTRVLSMPDRLHFTKKF